MNEEVSSIVHQEWGNSATIERQLTDGLTHETYVVRTDEGNFILQLAGTNEKQINQLTIGLDWYKELQDTAISVPQIITEEVREFNGRKYIIVEKLPGDSGHLDITPERVLNGGRYLAKLHAIRTFEKAGWFRFDDQGVSIEEFREKSEGQWRHRKVQDSAEYLQASGLETVGGEIEKLFTQESLESPKTCEPVFCHNDYSPDNVLFQDGEVAGVIDFDLAYAGTCHRDIVNAANGFWMHDPGADWDIRSTFYEGYRDVRELDSAFEENEPKVRVETLGVTVGGLANMDELSDYEKEFYSERILESIERVTQS